MRLLLPAPTRNVVLDHGGDDLFNVLCRAGGGERVRECLAAVLAAVLCCAWQLCSAALPLCLPRCRSRSLPTPLTWLPLGRIARDAGQVQHRKVGERVAAVGAGWAGMVTSVGVGGAEGVCQQGPWPHLQTVGAVPRGKHATYEYTRR